MKTRKLLGLVLLALLSTLVLAASAAASTLTVTTSSDADDGACTASVCTLRDAVKYSASGDAVSLPAGTYRLTASAGGDLVIAHNLTIVSTGTARTTLI